MDIRLIWKLVLLRKKIKAKIKEERKNQMGKKKEPVTVKAKKPFLLNLKLKVSLRLWNLAIGVLTIMLIKLTKKLR
jgi:hypothetical protein